MEVVAEPPDPHTPHVLTLFTSKQCPAPNPLLTGCGGEACIRRRGAGTTSWMRNQMTAARRVRWARSRGGPAASRTRSHPHPAVRNPAGHRGGAAAEPDRPAPRGMVSCGGVFVSFASNLSFSVVPSLAFRPEPPPPDPSHRQVRGSKKEIVHSLQTQNPAGLVMTHHASAKTNRPRGESIDSHLPPEAHRWPSGGRGERRSGQGPPRRRSTRGGRPRWPRPPTWRPAAGGGGTVGSGGDPQGSTWRRAPKTTLVTRAWGHRSPSSRRYGGSPAPEGGGVQRGERKGRRGAMGERAPAAMGRHSLGGDG